MPRDLVHLSFLAPRAELGTVVLRLFLAFVLVYGTQDNVFSTARMHEFRDFLAAKGFPVPMASAYLSAWAQFLCGLLIAAGALTRWAALVMILNFAVALGMVHLKLPFQANIAPLAMFFGSVFLLFHGPGPYSFDERKRRAD